MGVLVGAIADDFTGASDLASTLAREGMRVVQVIGVPDEDTNIYDAEAVIVALKSRTASVGEAVRQSHAAPGPRHWVRNRLHWPSNPAISVQRYFSRMHLVCCHEEMPLSR